MLICPSYFIIDTVFVQQAVCHCVCCRSSMQCIRSMESDYALSSLFAPGDRHVIVGTMVSAALTLL